MSGTLAPPAPSDTQGSGSSICSEGDRPSSRNRRAAARTPPDDCPAPGTDAFASPAPGTGAFDFPAAGGADDASHAAHSATAARIWRPSRLDDGPPVVPVVDEAEQVEPVDQGPDPRLGVAADGAPPEALQGREHGPAVDPLDPQVMDLVAADDDRGPTHGVEVGVVDAQERPDVAGDPPPAAAPSS